MIHVHKKKGTQCPSFCVHIQHPPVFWYHIAMKIIIRILITALALLLVAKIIPGIVLVGLYPALISAVILGLLHLVVKPILIILTLPITIVSLGLFMFVINAGLFMFAASFIDGFTVDGFVPALIGSLLVSVLTSIGHRFVN